MTDSLNRKLPVLSLDKMVEVLLKEGLSPRFDDECEGEGENEVTVEVNGLVMHVGGMHDGYVYVRAFVQASKIPLERLTLAANAVMEELMAIRVVFLEDCRLMAFSAESYCKDAAVFREYFRRSVKLVPRALDLLISKLCDLKEREEAEAGDEAEVPALAGGSGKLVDPFAVEDAPDMDGALADGVAPAMDGAFALGFEGTSDEALGEDAPDGVSADDPAAESFPDGLAALCRHSKRIVS